MKKEPYYSNVRAIWLVTLFIFVKTLYLTLNNSRLHLNGYAFLKIGIKQTELATLSFSFRKRVGTHM